MQLHGLITAIITPFGDSAVDYDALTRITLRAGVHSTAFVVLGTTAEPCSLSQDERDAILRHLQVTTAKPLIVGVTGNDTATVVQSALHYQAMGASALLVLTPYYNRCSTAGLVAHFRAVAEAVDLPVILYNVPSRTGVDITPDTLARLLLLPHVIGVKEANADAHQIIRYAAVCRELGRALLCGDDCMLPLFRAVGCDVAVSAAANAIPDVVAGGLSIPLADMPRWLVRYMPLLERMFTEVNPIGVKAACAHLGLCANRLRLPLTHIEDNTLSMLLTRAGFSIVND